MANANNAGVPNKPNKSTTNNRAAIAARNLQCNPNHCQLKQSVKSDASFPNDTHRDMIPDALSPNTHKHTLCANDAETASPPQPGSLIHDVQAAKSIVTMMLSCCQVLHAMLV